MKLHLPSGLRKALMACLAAFAFPVATVASGSLALSGVALVFAAQASSAQQEAPLPASLDEADDEEDADAALAEALAGVLALDGPALYSAGDAPMAIAAVSENKGEIVLTDTNNKYEYTIDNDLSSTAWVADSLSNSCGVGRLHFLGGTGKQANLEILGDVTYTGNAAQPGALQLDAQRTPRDGSPTSVISAENPYVVNSYLLLREGAPNFQGKLYINDGISLLIAAGKTVNTLGFSGYDGTIAVSGEGTATFTEKVTNVANAERSIGTWIGQNVTYIITMAEELAASSVAHTFSGTGAVNKREEIGDAGNRSKRGTRIDGTLQVDKGVVVFEAHDDETANKRLTLNGNIIINANGGINMDNVHFYGDGTIRINSGASAASFRGTTIDGSFIYAGGSAFDYNLVGALTVGKLVLTNSSKIVVTGNNGVSLTAGEVTIDAGSTLQISNTTSVPGSLKGDTRVGGFVNNGTLTIDSWTYVDAATFMLKGGNGTTTVKGNASALNHIWIDGLDGTSTDVPVIAFEGDVTVASGIDLKFVNRGKGSIAGSLSGDGNLVMWGGELKLKKGGSIAYLNMTYGGSLSEIIIGGDFEFRGVSSFSTGSARKITKDQEATGTVRLTRGISTEMTVESLEKFITCYADDSHKLVVDAALAIGKSGDGTLTVTGAETVTRDFMVKGGEVVFQDAMDFSGGKLSVSSGTLTAQAAITAKSGDKLTLGSGAALSLAANGASYSGTVEVNGGSFTLGNHTGLSIGGLNLVSGGSIANGAYTGLMIEQSLTITGGVAISKGQTLHFGTYNKSWTIQGEVSGAGDMNVYNSQLTLEKGANLSGVLKGGYQGRISTKKDIYVGSITNDGGLTINNANGANGDTVYIHITNSNATTLAGLFPSINLGDNVEWGDVSTENLTLSDGGTAASNVAVSGASVFNAGNTPYIFNKNLTVSKGGTLTVNAPMQVKGDTILADGADLTLANAADGNTLGNLKTKVVTASQSVYESEVSLNSGTWLATSLEVAAGTKLTLGGAWAGARAATLNVSSVKLDGTLVLKSTTCNSSVWQWDLDSPVAVTAGANALFVLDFSNRVQSYSNGYNPRPAIAFFTGTYDGAVELKGDIFHLVCSVGGKNIIYKNITVDDGAQLWIDSWGSSTPYTGAITISGMGAEMAAGTQTTVDHTSLSAGEGALRLETKYAGTLTLADDAAVTVYSGYTGELGGSVTSQSGERNTLYKHGAGKLTISASVAGLSGLISRQYICKSDQTHTGAGDGGDISITSKSFDVGSSEFIIGVGSAARNITFEEGSVLSGKGSIRKQGAGTLILNGTLAYTGNLTLEGGTTVLNYSEAAGAVAPLLKEVALAGGSSLKIGSGKSIGIDRLSDTGAATTARTISADADATLSLTPSADSVTSARITGGHITLEKLGENSQTISGRAELKKAQVWAGTLALTGGGTLGAADVQTGGALQLGGSMSLAGAATGAGSLVLDAASLTLSAGNVADSFTGLLSLRGGSELILERTFSAGGISDLGATASGTQHISGKGVLQLHVGEGVEQSSSANIMARAGSTIELTGKGTQTFSALSSAGTVIVKAGRLKLVGNVSDSYLADLQVEGGATLEINRHDWVSIGEQGTTITLKDGATLEAPIATKGSDYFEIDLNALKLEGTSVFRWVKEAESGSAHDRIDGSIGIVFDELTGARGSRLNVEGFGNETYDDANNRRCLVFNMVRDFNGTLYASDMVYSENGPSHIAVNHVSQAAGCHGVIDVEGGVFSQEFRKFGDGIIEFTEQSGLTIAIYAGKGRLYMEYAGEVRGLTENNLHVSEGVTLVYTTGSNEKLLRWDVEELQRMRDGVYVNVDELMSRSGGLDALRGGISLGIVGVQDSMDISDLEARIAISGADADTQWHLENRSGTLWLVVDEFVPGESDWDVNWTLYDRADNEPNRSDLQNSRIHEEDLSRITASGADFSQNALSLNAEGNSGSYVAPGQRLIMLDRGSESEDTAATVLGGVLQTGNETLLTRSNTWILLSPGEDGNGEQVEAHYHMLVGGSSCLSAEAVGSGDRVRNGFEGNTHIQMEGGTVDYIVGGNHVTNSAFSFNGGSFISVMSGEVRGGIVGGSTLTSANTDGTQEFSGMGSHIFIYTPLHNSPAEMSLGGEATAPSLSAVVGGNAWVALPGSVQAASLSPIFRAGSVISIDLSSVPADDKMTFEKDIVGGNYTSFVSSDFSGLVGSSFVGNATVSISIGERADEDVVFTGSITGASRVAYSGAGTTTFVGNATVKVDGGTYLEAIVGGMRFDHTATGKHSARFGGEVASGAYFTRVDISRGNIWRVVGGSYTLAGSAPDSVEEGAETIGNAFVSITGGSFAPRPDAQAVDSMGQTAMGFVAGGDFYRSAGGRDHERRGDTQVDISGGSFSGVYIVGGDYANFTGAGSESAVSINGSSAVSINGSSIIGLVIGGSYLTDESGTTGSEVAVKSTSVSIEGGEVKAAQEGGLAVVAGHVLEDMSAARSGGHKAVVGEGGSSLSMTGGSISGHVVGGSYANETSGVNELTTSGAVSVSLTGGKLQGDVYGGHYSDNTTTPDTLQLGDVSILLGGSALVEGDIVGGSFRKAEKTTAEGVQQGEISISLTGGELRGNVYAAGRHTDANAALTVSTAATTVSVGAGAVLGSAEQSIVISGGYDKASSNDKSTVKAAKLVFETEQGVYSNVDHVSAWTAFDTVENRADVRLAGRVTVREGAASFAKSGAGKLTLAQGLLSDNGKAYAGRLQVNDGILALGVRTQLAALGFDMTSRLGSNTVETAYLQTDGAGVLALSAASKVAVSITRQSAPLRAGIYYLTGELDAAAILGKKAEDLFSWSQSELDALVQNSGVQMQANLIIQNGCLVLRTHVNDTKQWFWQGDESGEWSNGSADDWSREGSTLEQDAASGDLAMADVHFNAGADNKNVNIKGIVTPHNVYVESGDFVFTGGSMSLLDGGLIYVGDNNEDDPASLTLAQDNTYVPGVVLQTGGTLALASAKAIDGKKTAVDFNGGLLVYAEEDGKLLFAEDVSALVVKRDEAAGQGMGVVRLQVGNAAAARSAVSVQDAPAVTWGSATATRASNSGLSRALSDGIEKSGRGTFTLNWLENTPGSTTLAGSIDVLGGTLVFDLVTGNPVDNSLPAVTLGGAAANISAGATFRLLASGPGRVTINRAFSGEGRVEIGDGAAGSYAFGANALNGKFAGEIALVGDSAVSTQVSVADSASLGGAATTLELAGRQVHFRGTAASGGSRISAGVVHVAEGSVNYLGGESFTSTSDPNVSISLAGKLTGSGVLANARGGYMHTLENGLGEFSGALVAGANGVGRTEGNTSTWTIRGEAPAAAVCANMAGVGIIDFAYTGAAGVTLAGRVGDAVLGDAVSLRNSGAGSTIILANSSNSSSGTLIFNGGDFQIGVDKDVTGSWQGGMRGDHGTFTLVSGSIARITDRHAVSVVANVADHARMEVSGTEGSQFSAIYVHQNARLTGVSGAITASSLNVSGVSLISLELGEKNIGKAAGSPEQYMIGMQQGGTLHVDDVAGFRINFANKAFMQTLADMRSDEENGNRVYLHILDGGTLTYAEGVQDDFELIFEGTGVMLKDLGFRLNAATEFAGDIELTGASSDVYLLVGPDDAPDARSESRHVTEWDQLDGFYATVLDENATLHIAPNRHNETLDPESGELVTNDRIVVNNLVGLEGSTLHATNDIDFGDDVVTDITIELNNTRISDLKSLDELDGAGLGSVGSGLTKEDINGQDTLFEGSIIGEEHVNFDKTGKGTLTVGCAGTLSGGLQVHGEFALSEGSVVVAGDLSGRHNEVGALVFNYNEPASKDAKRGFELAAGTTTLHDIVEQGAYKGDDLVTINAGATLIYRASSPMAQLDSVRFEGGKDGGGLLEIDASVLVMDSSNVEQKTRMKGISLSVGSMSYVTLSGGTIAEDVELSVSAGSISMVDSALKGASSVHLQEGGLLSLAEASSLDISGAVKMEADSSLSLTDDSRLSVSGGFELDGALDLASSKGNSITNLSGSGVLTGAVAEGSAPAELALHGKDNVFSGTLDGAGKLTIGAQDALRLERIGRGKSPGTWDLTSAGDLTVDLRDGAKSVLGDLHLDGSSTTTLIINTDEGSVRMGKLDLSNFTWDSGAHLTISNTGHSVVSEESIDLGRLTGDLTKEAIDIKLEGTAFSHYKGGALRKDVASARWTLDLVLSEENLFRTDKMEKNAAAGADMLWAASDPHSVNWKRITDDPDAPINSALYRLVDAVSRMDTKTQQAELSRTLAAAAGSGASVLGMALAQDLERQLHAVRNRTTSMSPGAAEESNFNIWLNAETSYRKLSADGLAPGYSLSNWGGTLAIDTATSANTTVGLALSALYGDLKTESADNARGDMDTTYATVFARVNSGSWTHTFLVSGGMADVSLNRTVRAGAFSYSASGSTDGYMIGAMYELGHTSIMNAQGTFLLQSVFNVALRHASINGYTETGCDAALDVDGMTYTALTIGAGARAQAVVGTRALNRDALLEGRLLVKGDVGDRSGKVNNDFVNGNNARRELESAEIGAVGIEIGAGVSVPVGKRGSVFIDASLELRSRYSSMDANAGYRMSF